MPGFLEARRAAHRLLSCRVPSADYERPALLKSLAAVPAASKGGSRPLIASVVKRPREMKSAYDLSLTKFHFLSPSYLKCHSWPALSVVTIVDAVSRQRLTAAPSLSACALIS